MKQRLCIIGLLLFVAFCAMGNTGCEDILGPRHERLVGWKSCVRYPVTMEIDNKRISCDVHPGDESIAPDRYEAGTSHSFYAYAPDPRVFQQRGSFKVPMDSKYTCAGTGVSVRIDIGGSVHQ